MSSYQLKTGVVSVELRPPFKSVDAAPPAGSLPEKIGDE
jgi:hypothetical protein